MNVGLILVSVAVAASAAIALTPTFEQPDASLGAAPSPRLFAPSTAPFQAPNAAEAVSPAVAALRFASAEPGAAPAPGSAPAPVVNTAPTLVGLAFGGRPVAYVMAGGKPWRAAVGEPVAGWRMAAIGKHEVTLRRAGESLTLRLFTPRASLSPQMPLTPFAAASAPPQLTPPSVATPTAQTAPAPPAPTSHALPPANGPRYWVGPPGSAPPGYTPMPTSDLPPPPVGRR